MRGSTWLEYECSGISKTNETYSFKSDSSIEAHCDYDPLDSSPKLYQFSDKNICVETEHFKLGLDLGNQYHRTGRLKRSQMETHLCSTMQRDRSRGCRPQKKNES
eukprot:15803721-Heterocapsa_arctica.AAC.1